MPSPCPGDTNLEGMGTTPRNNKLVFLMVFVMRGKPHLLRGSGWRQDRTRQRGVCGGSGQHPGGHSRVTRIRHRTEQQRSEGSSDTASRRCRSGFTTGASQRAGSWERHRLHHRSIPRSPEPGAGEALDGSAEHHRARAVPRCSPRERSPERGGDAGARTEPHPEPRTPNPRGPRSGGAGGTGRGRGGSEKRARRGTGGSYSAGEAAAAGRGMEPGADTSRCGGARSGAWGGLCPRTPRPGSGAPRSPRPVPGAPPPRTPAIARPLPPPPLPYIPPITRPPFSGATHPRPPIGTGRAPAPSPPPACPPTPPERSPLQAHHPRYTAPPPQPRGGAERSRTVPRYSAPPVPAGAAARCHAAGGGAARGPAPPRRRPFRRRPFRSARGWRAGAAPGAGTLRRAALPPAARSLR
ncbi:basic salivary proline-rich protein 3-like [Melospiza melodia melodia]|uniref:basic salivary proline-rich protein 3-like n=1 Tax=Melospiza melodia melodia TaxID=1914991 RepID=UPI002FD72EC5